MCGAHTAYGGVQPGMGGVQVLRQAAQPGVRKMLDGAGRAALAPALLRQGPLSVLKGVTAGMCHCSGQKHRLLG